MWHGLDPVSRSCRDGKSTPSDAARRLRRAPWFALITIATLALAIGANTAIFSVVDAVLIDPLPFPDSSRLVVIRGTAPGSDLPPEFAVGPEFFVAYRDDANLLENRRSLGKPSFTTLMLAVASGIALVLGAIGLRVALLGVGLRHCPRARVDGRAEVAVRRRSARPPTFVAMSVLMVIVALLASYIPAHRASGVIRFGAAARIAFSNAKRITAAGTRPSPDRFE